jgi:hypothetical protein
VADGALRRGPRRGAKGSGMQSLFQAGLSVGTSGVHGVVGGGGGGGGGAAIVGAIRGKNQRKGFVFGAYPS